MTSLLREAWDLLGIATVACWLLGLILWALGLCTLGTVLVAGPVCGIVVVFCGLWILAMAGGTIPW